MFEFFDNEVAIVFRDGLEIGLLVADFNEKLAAVMAHALELVDRNFDGIAAILIGAFAGEPEAEVESGIFV